VADEGENNDPVVEADREDPADRILDELAQLEPELRGAAIVDGEGRPCAVRSERVGWGEDAVSLLKAVDEAGGRPVDSVHIATEKAEVFVVREGGLALVAVTGRFVLASLTGFDMRMSLRDLAAEAGNGPGEAVDA
jgi:predicted regulator of Ras-like GTPase activity (Roadblock/LC7/MglB family)